MKAKIKRLISERKYDEALDNILIYKQKIKNDSEIYLLKSLCEQGKNEFIQAETDAILAVKNMPYVVDAHYNLGYIYEVLGKWAEAYEQYSIAEQLVIGGNLSSYSREEILNCKQEVIKKIADEIATGTKEELITRKRKLDYIIIQDDLFWTVNNPIFHDESCIITKEYMDYLELPKMYLGITGAGSVFDCCCNKLKKDTKEEATEIQRVGEKINFYEVNTECESFLPIIMENRDKLEFQIEDRKVDVANISPFQYVNYRIPKGHTVIRSNGSSFRVGEVIPIKHDNKRKKLVLNIFIDGLSQTVLGDGLKTLMPYTYRFFSKGLVCENVYTAGDWTFPSIASVVTGQTMAKHKMLHSKLLRKIDIDTPILFEYFKNAGYNTIKIGGNWRIAPNYGYARGMNHVYYQHMYKGYTADRVVAETIEQMHRMENTDQFIWIELGELHLISDEVNIPPLQSEFMVWENGAFEKKINSVKQKFDNTKRKYYLKQVEYIDRRLAGLYQYIEDNYKDNDILISLFSDHGQGYLIKQDDNFLSDARTKIPLMVRGGGMHGTTLEIISSCDYSSIMCKLAGIEYDYSNTDAYLPKVFGGDRERKFAVTESIHVGDPYQIVLNGSDFQFYLEGKENVTSECRVPLQEYDVHLLDEKGVESNDRERIEYYRDWCLDHVSSCVIY